MVDDVVQDTWAAALERTPEVTEQGGMRSWLKAVARNLSLRTRRRASIRDHVERIAARSETTESGVGDLDRLQLHKRLVEIVIELPEPCRSALTARYLDELSYDEIARRQACSVATARQRVSRGLTRLRNELDRRFHGDRDAWYGSIAALFDDSQSTGVQWSSAGAGMVAMGVKGWVISTGAVVSLTFVAAVWLRSTDDTAARDSLIANQAEVSPVVSRDETTPMSVPQSETEVSRLVALDQSVSDARATLEGLVTDTAGQPLPEARIRLLPLDAGADDDPLAEWASDERGGFTLTLPAARDAPAMGDCTLEFALDGYVAQRTAPRVGERIEIALARLPRIRGRVLAPAGKQLAPPWELKAVIRIDGVPSEQTREAVVDWDGSYTIAAAPVGVLTLLSARARGFGRAESVCEIALELDGVVTRDLELPAGATLEGRVIDALTGAPIADAKVWADEYFVFNPDGPFPMTKTDAAGNFRLEGATLTPIAIERAAHLAHVMLGVEAHGYAPLSQRLYSCNSEEDETCRIKLSLDPQACRFAAVVFMPDGVDPAGGSMVHASDARGNLRFAVTADDGSFTLDDLAPGAFAVDVLRERGSQRLRVRKSIELEPTRRLTERLVLIAGDASIAGRLVDLAGAPVSGARLDLATYFDGPGMSLIATYTSTHAARDGNYRFEGIPPGRYFLGVDSESERTACSRPGPFEIELESGQTRGEVDFVVGACMTVQGQVDLFERSAEGLGVSLHWPGETTAVVEAGVDADGTFRFDPVLAGAYDVILSRDSVVLDRTTARPGSESGLVLKAR